LQTATSVVGVDDFQPIRTMSMTPAACDGRVTVGFRVVVATHAPAVPSEIATSQPDPS
jgi:hypothetical protein